MNWEVIKLNKYCAENSILFPEDKIKYLNEKINRYYFVREEIKVLSEKYFNKNKKSHILDTNLIYLNYSYSNIFELTSTIIFSIFEIMGFIINTLLLGGEISENQVSFNKIGEKLNKTKKYKKINEKITEIKNDLSFQYYISFNNTIKHRGIIKNFFKIGMKDTFIDDFKYPYIKAFDYKGKKYDECSIEKFIEYGNINVKMIIELGSLINEELLK